MNIHEYQAAELLARYGIPTNPGTVATTPEEVEAGRSSRNWSSSRRRCIRAVAERPAASNWPRLQRKPRRRQRRSWGSTFKGHIVHKVLVAPGVAIAREFYLGVVLDRPNRQVVVMASAEGGVEIEEVAKTAPEKIGPRTSIPGLVFRRTRQGNSDLTLASTRNRSAGLPISWPNWSRLSATRCDVS